MDWFNCTCVKDVRVCYGYWIKDASKLYSCYYWIGKNVRETTILFYIKNILNSGFYMTVYGGIRCHKSIYDGFMTLSCHK